MKYFYIAITLFFIGKLDAQSDTKISYHKNDTLILSDKSCLIPKWNVETSSFIGFSNHFRSFYGLGLAANYKLNGLFNFKAQVNKQVFDEIFEDNKIVNTFNYFIALEYNFLKKNKVRKCKYFKRFFNDSLNLKYKPIVYYNILKMFNLNLGFRKNSLNNLFTKYNDFVIVNDYQSYFDTEFDSSESPIDYDGFINEVRSIEMVNHYSLNIGFSYSTNKNYAISIDDQRVKRNNKSEIYLNFLYRLYYSMKYDGRIENSKIENDFDGRIDSKKLGFNLGYKFTKGFKNNQSSIFINFEYGILPDFVYNKDFHKGLSQQYILTGYFPATGWGNFFNDDFYQNYYAQYNYFQLAVGYTFGQKLK